MDKNPQSCLQEKLAHAIDVVKAYLESDPAVAFVATPDAPPLLSDCSAIWRKAIRVMDKERIVYVGLPPGFPDEVPKACLAEWEDLHLRNPHVDDRGFICTIPDSAAVDSNDPIALVRRVFEDAEQILQGTSTTDFQSEFSSYWERSVTDRDHPVHVIDPVERLTTPFSITFCERAICAGASVERINRWISNRTGKPSELKEEKAGIRIHLNAPLIPREYPSTLAQLVSLAELHDRPATDLLKKHIATKSGKGLALLVQTEGDGVALGGIVFEGLGLSGRDFPGLTHGFRPGRVPAEVLLKRASKLIAASPVTRNVVARLDHKWIHSRGGDGRDLYGKSVLVIGCGSLGGYVAHLLSRAGVGRLTLTDNDVLDWDNLGRHILGASSVGRWKAEALAEKLLRELPHLSITGIPKDWREVIEKNPNLFAEHDLVISTTGDWRCERPLNELARTTKMPPVLFGWLEPHGVAGHCLGVTMSGGCFRCGANRFGQFLYSVAEYDKTPLSREPGGCTHYQHYGPTALLSVASMIASTVIESLLAAPTSSFLATWISSEDHFKAAKAKLANAWVSEASQSGFSRMCRRSWPPADLCTLCRTTKS